MGTQMLKYLGVLLFIQISLGNRLVALNFGSAKEVQIVGGFSLDPEKISDFKHRLRGMDIDAVTELLRTKQPVIRSSTTSNGTPVTITYSITPNNQIKMEKVTSEIQNLHKELLATDSEWISSPKSFDSFYPNFRNNFFLTHSDPLTTTTTTTTIRSISKPITRINLDALPATKSNEPIDITSFLESVDNISEKPLEIPQRNNYGPLGTSFGNQRNSEEAQADDETISSTYPKFEEVQSQLFDTTFTTVRSKSDGRRITATCRIRKSGKKIPIVTSSSQFFTFLDKLDWSPEIVNQYKTGIGYQPGGSKVIETCLIKKYDAEPFLKPQFPALDVTTTERPSFVPISNLLNKISKPKLSEPESEIEKFLRKIDITAADIQAQNGEYVKNIVEDNGRILSIKLLLSQVKGDDAISSKQDLSGPLK